MKCFSAEMVPSTTSGTTNKNNIFIVFKNIIDYNRDYNIHNKYNSTISTTYTIYNIIISKKLYISLKFSRIYTHKNVVQNGTLVLLAILLVFFLLFCVVPVSNSVPVFLVPTVVMTWVSF